MPTQLHVNIGTRIKIKTNEAIGICTVIKIDHLVDEFGDKTNIKAAKYVDVNGNPRGCTPLHMLTDQHFEII